MISDVDQVLVQVLAGPEVHVPLDTSFAQVWGVSEVQLQYLRNLGSQATLTLSVVLDGQLWGIISFHRRRPKGVPSGGRQVLTGGFLPAFCLKLQLLRARAMLKRARRMDKLQRDIRESLGSGVHRAALLERIGSEICDMLQIDGVAVVAGRRLSERLWPLLEPARD